MSAHELVALAQPVAHRALLAWADVARGQDIQAQQVFQMPRVAEVPTMLQTVVLLDGGDVDQVHDRASILHARD